MAAIAHHLSVRTICPGRWLLLAALAACPLLSGCLTLPWAPKEEPKEKAPEGRAVYIATKWENYAIEAPDTQHEGRPVKCLACRLYLFGNDINEPIACDGGVKIQLRCNDVLDEEGQPRLIEEWPLPASLLPQMCSKDLMGWGYSLLLPWATYHPQLRNVTLVVAFTPKGGFPLYSRTKIKLQDEESKVAVQSSVLTPGAAASMQPNGPAPGAAAVVPTSVPTAGAVRK